MENLIFKLWFCDLPIKNSLKIDILNNGFKPEEFWNLSLKDYIQAGIDITNCQLIDKSKNINKYSEISEYIKKEEIEFVLYSDVEYPKRLRYIYNPPVGLFVKGKLIDVENSIAIVGSRKASEYGKTAAYKLSYELGKRGITVISGLARGIDGCAHFGCLESGGYTIGVMGSGFKYIYPAENRKLYMDIVKHGCVITEYYPDIRPFAHNFPERNRIISGISKYVLVVEAGEKSGSLITATLALEQGKDVFAVPGNIFSPNSLGTNNLIKDGAKLISKVEDILEEFSIDEYIRTTSKNNVESKIIDLLKNGAMTLWDLSSQSGMAIDELLSNLSRLECGGIIKRAYGNYYILC